LARGPLLCAERAAEMNRKVGGRIFHAFERELAIPAVQTTVDIGDGFAIADNAAGLVLLAGVGFAHVVLQQRSRWLHTLHRQSSGSSKARGSNSPARVASMMLTARSL